MKAKLKMQTKLRLFAVVGVGMSRRMLDLSVKEC
jgi:hypothetical protein